MVALVNLVVDQNPSQHMDIELNWNSLHRMVLVFVVDLQLYCLDYLMDHSMVFGLDHRYFLVADQLAMRHWK